MDQLGALTKSSHRPHLVVEGDPGEPSRVALLASSFDPMTVAHAALAEAASYTNDRVLLVTSPATLPKEGSAEPSLLEDEQRVGTLRAWCGAHRFASVAVCSHGLVVDQVLAARARFPNAELSVYCGSDKLVQLFDPRWYDDRDSALEDLFGQATVSYAQRSGYRSAVAAALADSANRRWAPRCRSVPLHPALADVSSREVRRRIRSGEPWRELVPVEILTLIVK